MKTRPKLNLEGKWQQHGRTHFWWLLFWVATRSHLLLEDEGCIRCKKAWRNPSLPQTKFPSTQLQYSLKDTSASVWKAWEFCWGVLRCANEVFQALNDHWSAYSSDTFPEWHDILRWSRCSKHTALLVAENVTYGSFWCEYRPLQRAFLEHLRPLPCSSSSSCSARWRAVACRSAASRDARPTTAPLAAFDVV